MANERDKAAIPHDEAFKKLLQAFFEDFMALFFPEVHQALDYSKAKLLMQEQLVDIVGGKLRAVDLLMESQLAAADVYVLVHFEPQAYRDEEFAERMFIYFGRLFEKYRKTHKQIIPVAIFTGDYGKEEAGGLVMTVPGSGEEVVRFQYLNVRLRSRNWREFADSDNPVAAALLAKMGYNRKERRELRLAYLKMLLRLKDKLDDARMALVMSIADLYYEPVPEEDEQILNELRASVPEEEAFIMELMPAWKRWGYEEGIEQGIEQGQEHWRLEERKAVVRKLLTKGMTPESVAELLELPLTEVRRMGEPEERAGRD